ncbi:MAG: hypothetical protein ABSG73_04665 [Candidatus Aminicenantales bacterium]|jgi:hypothetical protein
MAGEYIIIKQNQYMRVFRKAEAVDRGRAKPLDVLGVRETGIFRRMMDRGVFINAGGNLYYMDPNAAKEFVAARRKRVFFMLVLALIALLVLWVFNAKIFR